MPEESKRTNDERAFRDFCRKQIRRRVEQTFLFSVVFFGVAWIIGRIVLSGHALETPGRFWLTVLLSLSFGGWLVFRYLPQARRRPTFFALALGMAIAGCAATHTSEMSDLNGPFFYAIYILPPITIGLAVELRERMLMTLAWPASWVVAYFGAHPSYLEHRMLHVPAIILFGALIVSVFLGHQAFLAVRDRFMLGRRLDRQRAQLEKHTERLEEEVEQSSEAVERLSKVLASTSMDREDVARALHDDLGQLIVGVRMELETLERKLALLPDASPRKGERLEHLSTVVETLDQSVRSFIDRLREPQPVEDLGESLEALLAPLRAKSGVAIEAAVALDGPVDARVRELLYRLVQEAVTNAFKHAQARRITIAIAGSEGGVVAAVTDDGRGFAEDATAGLGIRGLRERAEAAGGELTIESSHEGTEVRLELPEALLEAVG